MPDHFLSSKSILISGAGLSSLSFTIALSKLWPESHGPPPRITLLERDPSPSTSKPGRQGYSLSLSGYDDTGGLVALRDLGLLDEILSCATAGGPRDTGRFMIWDHDWRKVMSLRFRPVAGIPASTIRVARKDLRRILLDAVPEEVEVRWGVSCLSAEKGVEGRVKVEVMREDGEKESVEGDALVIADGAGSRIRGRLRGEGLEDAGAVQMVGIADFEERQVPEPVDVNWGLQLTGKGVTCFYAPLDTKSVLWALSFLEDKPRARAVCTSSGEMQPVLEEALRRGEALGPLFKRLVDATVDYNGVSVFPARDKKPFGHEACHDEAPIVFIGDSNHAVSPFAGYGANLALKDGWDLAQCLVSSLTADEALKKYDAVSVPRAKKVLETSRSRIHYLHSTGAKFFVYRMLLVVGGYVAWLFGMD